MAADDAGSANVSWPACAWRTDPHDAVPDAPAGAAESQVLRHAPTATAAEDRKSRVDGVLGHPAVGGELAAGDRDHAVRRGPDGVAPRQVRGSLARRALAGHWCEQRTEARPDASDVGRGEELGGDRVGCVEEILDVLGRAVRIVERSVHRVSVVPR